MLDRSLAAGALPDLAQLQRHFAATAIPIPDVTVHLPPIASYDALLATDTSITSHGAAA